jgi:hypothetical protein
MESIKWKILISMIFIIGVGMWSPHIIAQPKYDVNINANEYDVLFLTEFFNVRSQKLSSSVSGFSVDIIEQAATGASRWICAEVIVRARLRGDADTKQLVQGLSRAFEISGGRKTLTAFDFAGYGIASADASKPYTQDLKLKRRIAELAQTTPTAPPGTYQITVIVHDSSAANFSASPLGKDTKTIVIPYSSVDEVFVEINDPKNGSFFTNLAPTFSWTSSEKDVRVSVYEAGTNHHSPQDVLTGGNPCLVWESFSKNINSAVLNQASLTTNDQLQSQQKGAGFNGTSLTYPSNAQRQLQQEKAYVLQVEARVSTNRGLMMRPSRPVVFRITDDKVGKVLDNFVNTLDNNVSSPYLSLRSDPIDWIFWSPYGDIMLDGVKQTETDLQTLLKDLASRTDVKVELDVESE